MFDIYLRNLKDYFYLNTLFPIFSFLSKLKITPNMITGFGFLIGLVTCYFCYFNKLKLAFIFWVMNRFIDGLDGIYARKTGQTSEFGGYLDIIADFIIYSLIPIFLVFNCSIDNIQWHSGLSLALMLGSFFVNSASLFMLSAIIEKINIKRRNEVTTVNMPPALIEGFETVILISLMIILSEYLTIIFYSFSLLVSVNIIQRLILAYQNLPN